MLQMCLRYISIALCLTGVLSGCARSAAQVPQPVTTGTFEALTLRHQVEASMADHPLMAFGIPLKAKEILQEFYLERNFQPAWHGADLRPTPQALALLDMIGRIGDEGLMPRDYHHNRLQKMVHAPGGEYLEYDLLLSDAVANLSRHLLMGKVNPESISPDWKATPRQRDLVEVMEQLTAEKDVVSRLQQLRPQQVRYVRLLTLLAQLNRAAPLEWRPLARTSAIKPGNTDARLPAIRERLQFWGDLPAAETAADAQSYDAALQAAVRRFQRATVWTSTAL